MSPATDRAAVEDRVRAALQARAEATVVSPADRFVPRPAARAVERRPRRVALTVGAGAVAAGLVIAVIVSRDSTPHVRTDRSEPGGAPSTTAAPGEPAESQGTRLPGLAGSRWFVLGLPGVEPTSAYRERVPPDDDNPPLQAFRTDAGFAGPMAWVETVPAGADFGFGDGAPGAEEVTVQGRTGYLVEDGDQVRLGVPGDGGEGQYVTAMGLPAADVVAFADGLRARPGGVDATNLPRGLAEVAVDDGTPASGEAAEWSYTGDDGANYELFVNPGSAAVFEFWAREHVASGGTVEAISVGGRPGLILHREGESVVVWRPTDDMVADFRTSVSGDDLLAALDGLHAVDEATWLDHLPPAIRPEPPADNDAGAGADG